MNMSKRSFLKLGMGGTAALFLAPMLRPRSLFAAPVVLAPDYLESRTHSYWMKLSHNNGLESRATRRTVGAVLRNLGIVQGAGRGQAFAGVFDQAVDRAFQRHLLTGEKPGTLLGLVQWLYDEFILPEHGPEAGSILYAVLLSLLRGRDGSAAGSGVHGMYLNYRAAAVRHKDAYRMTEDPKELLEARRTRQTQRLEWQQALLARAQVYALRKEQLNRQYPLDAELLAGWDIQQVVMRVVAPRLHITHVGDQVRVAWEGPAQLQKAPTVRGPWTDVAQDSPAVFDIQLSKQFFRTVQPEPLIGLP